MEGRGEEGQLTSNLNFFDALPSVGGDCALDALRFRLSIAAQGVFDDVEHAVATEGRRTREWVKSGCLERVYASIVLLVAHPISSIHITLCFGDGRRQGGPCAATLT